MPLPSDEKVVQLANQLLEAFASLFGKHPGFRPVHAKGILLQGTFTPTHQAPSVTRAPHGLRASTPVVVRFSDGTGLPMIADHDPKTNPKGCAIRFYLADHVHTDIVSHSTDGFPAKNGAEFLEFLQAVASGKAPDFLATHPAARAFAQPQPSQSSFATEAYFGVTAFRFINLRGVARFGRYQIVPEAGIKHLDAETAKSMGDNYLFEEIKERLAKSHVRMDLQVQMADEGDVVNDSTVHWPASRSVTTLGAITLTALAPDDEAHQRIIFDPIPRVEGIEPSDDPLLELRAAAYLLAGRKRREAIDAKSPVEQRA